MCDWDECDAEATMFVDLDPNGMTVTRPGPDAVADPETGEISGETHEVELSTQRLGFCVEHSVGLGLSRAVSRGTAIRSSEHNPFPKTHILSIDHACTWKVK